MTPTSPALVVVIGQGYVGLPLAMEASRAGMRVVGFDLNPDVVEGLNAGKSHVGDVSDSEIAEMVRHGYAATSDEQVLADAEVVVICVPTPLGDDGRPDLTAVESSVDAVAHNLRSGALVILESTTYPGTTEGLVQPLLERGGRSIDHDFYLAFSPERIDPGNVAFTLRNTPKVVGGVTAASTRRAVAFYESFVESVIAVRGAKEAETAKLLENTFRHVNIALVNEMARFCHELDIDLWDVIRAASTKPFGFQAFYPGPGVGGHCIPIDPNYLSYEVKRRLGYPFRFVELAQEINAGMPRYVVDRVQAILNDEGKALRGASVLLLGVTYKANVADQRESPAVPIAALLAQRGATVQFHDPLLKEWMRDGIVENRVEDLSTALAAADIVVLLQAHDDYDVNDIASISQRVFDTRGTLTGDRVARL